MVSSQAHSSGQESSWPDLCHSALSLLVRALPFGVAWKHLSFSPSTGMGVTQGWAESCRCVLAHLQCCGSGLCWAPPLRGILVTVEVPQLPKSPWLLEQWLYGLPWL